MIDELVLDVIKENETTTTETRAGYLESIRRFQELVQKGMAEKRENQLLVDLSDTKYNI